MKQQKARTHEAMLPAEIFALPSCSLFNLILFATGSFSGTENPGVPAAGVNEVGVVAACVDGPGVPGVLGGGGILDAASSPETRLRNSPSEPASLGEGGTTRGISMVCSSTKQKRRAGRVGVLQKERPTLTCRAQTDKESNKSIY